MDNLSLLKFFFKISSYCIIFAFGLIQLPLYITLYVTQLLYYFITYYYSTKILKIKPVVSSLELIFPEKFSLIVYVKIYLYTPRYIAFCTFVNFLRFKKKKITIKILIMFIFVRIWIYFTGIPLYLFKLVRFWLDIIPLCWLNYNNTLLSLYFSQCLDNLFISNN